MKSNKELISALRNTNGENDRQLLDQAAAVLEYYVREEEEALAVQYRRFAMAASRLLGKVLAESVNNALHLYYASEEFHSYEDEKEDLLPLLEAFDAEGLNSIMPEYDVLRGGQFPSAAVAGGGE